MPVIYTSPNRHYGVTYSLLKGRYEVRLVGDESQSIDWKVITHTNDQPSAIEAADQLDAAEERGEFDPI